LKTTRTLVLLPIGLCALAAQAQIDRMKMTDGDLTCTQLQAEVSSMDTVIGVAGSTPMGQQARARKEFLTGLFLQKKCSTGGVRSSSMGTAESPTAQPLTRVTVPAASISWASQLQVPSQLLDAGARITGKVQLKDKPYFVSEYRVMFEVGGSVTASTRAAYFGGTNYGATRMTVKYEAQGIDMAGLQAVTDKAYADFLARLEAAGVKPVSPEGITQQFGYVYEPTERASQPGAPVFDEVNLGYGKRRYLVFAPTGMKLHSRGMAGMGAGNLGARLGYIKGNVEAIAVSLAVNLAAQETSGGGSSLFKSGSSANASAAMEVVMGTGNLLQSHANTYGLHFKGTLPVPGDYATFRETGGYDTRQDAAVQGVQALGRMAGVAANQSKTVNMAMDVNMSAAAPMALQGLVSVNQAIAGIIQ
jgi:hypothetical protein